MIWTLFWLDAAEQAGDRLALAFAPDILKLEKLLGRDLGAWMPTMAGQREP